MQYRVAPTAERRTNRLSSNCEQASGEDAQGQNKIWQVSAAEVQRRGQPAPPPSAASIKRTAQRENATAEEANEAQ